MDSGRLAIAMLTVLAALVAGCSSGSEPEAVLAEPASTVPITGAPVPAPTTTVVPPTAADGEPVVATTPAGLAEQLAAAEAGIRNPATPAGDLRRLGWTQQVAYRTLVRKPEWRAEVLSLLPIGLRPGAQAQVAAGEDLRLLAGTPKPELPAWRIVPPPPASELLAEYRAAESALGVPWQYLAAIHLVETRMGRIRGTSTAGAQGPMQFIPSTWASYGAGGDINSNHDAILAAARLLKANGAPGDMANALYHYNPSQRYVRAVTAYAEQMRADERAYLGYHQWQVYYGDRLMPEGYGS